MPEYLSPGVYVEEVNTGPQPIEGVSTSTAGAVGVTRRGPTAGPPVLVTSFSEFNRIFGGYFTKPADVGKFSDPDEGGNWWQFPLHIKGFFDNGGKRLFVKRVIPRLAKAALGYLGSGVVATIQRVSFQPNNLTPSTTVLSLSSVIGISKGTQVTIIIDGLPSSSAPVKAFSSEQKTISVDFTERHPLIRPGRDHLIVGETPKEATDADATLAFKCREQGNGGNGIKVRVRPVETSLAVIPDTRPNKPAGVRTELTNEGRTVTIPISFTQPAANPFADADTDVTINGVPVTLRGFTEGVGVADDGTATVPIDRLNDALAWVAGTTKISKTAGPTEATLTTIDTTASFVTLTVAEKLPELTHDRGVLIGEGAYKVAEAITVANTTRTLTLQLDPAHPESFRFSPRAAVRAVRNARIEGNTLQVENAGRLYENALVELDDGKARTKRVVKSVGTDNRTVTLDGAPGDLNEDAKVRLIEAEVTIRRPTDSPGAEITEVFSFLRLSPSEDPRDLLVQVNSRSKLVTVRVANPAKLYVDAAATPPVFSELEKFPCGPGDGWVTLKDGDDAIATLSVDDFVGVDEGSGHRTGIQSFEDVDDISIVLAPGIWAKTVRTALIDQAQLRGDRFAVVEVRDGLSIQEVQDVRSVIDTTYAALYYPWLVVRDPVLGVDTRLAPSAHVAGIYARTDSDRGVHKAPANETILGISGIAESVTQREQDLLNPVGINALRLLPNRGFRVWGARTVSSDSDWRYINVRRLFIFLEKSIYRGLQFVVFEPNDIMTHARVRQTIENFLMTVWRDGALLGTTPEEAFFVKCDLNETMTEDDLLNGRLIALVGVAPVRPAEFVIIRIQQKFETTTP